MRFFELFDLPVQFSIDTNLLVERFRTIQKQVHPDKFASASDQQKLLAVQQASEINDAYETLKHPLTRAEYMVSEHGFDVRHEQETIKDGMFLMQQMELREELEDAEHAADPETALDDLYDDIKRLTDEYTDEFVAKFDAAQYKEAAMAVKKLRFIYKLKNEAQALEEKLLDF
ncbi:co-chaperone HscB [Psychrosphaera ytuae]|uniref:Co-chaperone protein HscB homolog n=1 Tax=Psychrosphaera ytuae TaxID=2820710 RepID=A0A975HJ94_9GAMM|nr:co-chaperone HscB [Psychrosphaera ytuae]QTH64993.1 co-chaperone HscB [Psychrosphaera ytuae]